MWNLFDNTRLGGSDSESGNVPTVADRKLDGAFGVTLSDFSSRTRFRTNPLFELVIHRNLETVGEAIVHVRDTDDAQQFAIHLIGHPFGDCC